jgi:hypothetical protein
MTRGSGRAPRGSAFSRGARLGRGGLRAFEAVGGQRPAQDGLDPPRVETVLARERIDRVPDEEVEQHVERVRLPPGKVDQMQMGGTMAMTAARASSTSMIYPSWVV